MVLTLLANNLGNYSIRVREVKDIVIFVEFLWSDSLRTREAKDIVIFSSIVVFHLSEQNKKK